MLTLEIIGKSSFFMCTCVCVLEISNSVSIYGVWFSNNRSGIELIGEEWLGSRRAAANFHSPRSVTGEHQRQVAVGPDRWLHASLIGCPSRPEAHSLGTLSTLMDHTQEEQGTRYVTVLLYAMLGITTHTRTHARPPPIPPPPYIQREREREKIYICN